MKTLKHIGLVLFLFGIWSYYSLAQNHPDQASYMYLLGYYMPAMIPFVLGWFLFFGARGVEKEQKENKDKDE